MANTQTPKRVDELETQVQALTERVQELECALSDMLKALDNGTNKPGYQLHCPTPVAMAALTVNHYGKLIQFVPENMRNF